MSKLSAKQQSKLHELVARGEIWAGCTNATLAALERKGLATWDHVAGRAFERWTPTDAARASLSDQEGSRG